MSKRSVFVIIAIILAVFGLYLQSRDAASAHSQSQAITAADQAGQDTTGQVARLKTFVATHMGTSVQIQLLGSYQRAQAVATESSRAAQSAQAGNAAIYAAAQAACSGKTDSITQAKCNTAYLQSHLTTAAIPSILPQPSLATYQSSLTSPFWTADGAGALMLGAICALIVAFVVPRKES